MELQGTRLVNKLCNIFFLRHANSQFLTSIPAFVKLVLIGI